MNFLPILKDFLGSFVAIKTTEMRKCSGLNPGAYGNASYRINPEKRFLHKVKSILHLQSQLQGSARFWAYYFKSRKKYGEIMIKGA